MRIIINRIKRGFIESFGFVSLAQGCIEKQQEGGIDTMVRNTDNGWESPISPERSFSIKSKPVIVQLRQWLMREAPAQKVAHQPLIDRLRLLRYQN